MNLWPSYCTVILTVGRLFGPVYGVGVGFGVLFVSACGETMVTVLKPYDGRLARTTRNGSSVSVYCDSPRFAPC